MGNLKIECPECGAVNIIDIFKASEGSKVLCKGCNKFITLHFEGKTPKHILNDVKKEIQRAFKIK